MVKNILYCYCNPGSFSPGIFGMFCDHVRLKNFIVLKLIEKIKKTDAAVRMARFLD